MMSSKLSLSGTSHLLLIPIIGSHPRVASTPNVAFTKVVRSIHLYEWATKRQMDSPQKVASECATTRPLSCQPTPERDLIEISQGCA
jgi:hypothetical protein